MPFSRLKPYFNNAGPRPRPDPPTSSPEADQISPYFNNVGPRPRPDPPTSSPPARSSSRTASTPPSPPRSPPSPTSLGCPLSPSTPSPIGSPPTTAATTTSTSALLGEAEVAREKTNVACICGEFPYTPRVNVMLKELLEAEFGPQIDFREYSFLQNPILSKQVKDSFLEVQLCDEQSTKCHAANETSRRGVLRFLWCCKDLSTHYYTWLNWPSYLCIPWF